MNKMFRGTALLLSAASAFGLARPAAAQAPALFPPTLATADAAAPDGAPPLPRVVPPKHLAPTAPGTINPTAPLAPAQAGVDLLAPPAVPSAWSATPTRAAVVPKATVKTPAPPPEHTPASSYPASMTPALRSAYSPAPPAPLAAPATRTGAPISLSPMPPNAQDRPLHAATQPNLTPLPAVASSAPAARPTPSPKKVWPPAFQTHDKTKPYETMGVVYFDKSTQPVKQAAATKPAPVVVAAAIKPAPVVVAAAAKPSPVAVPTVAASGDLRGRIAALCGADAMTVVTAKQPDGGTQVKVRVRDIDAEQKVINKVLQLPEMAEPTMHLVVEVKP